MSVAPALVLAFSVLVAPPAYAAPPKINALIAHWSWASQNCRGAPEALWYAQETTEACEREDRYERLLNRLGWCFGRRSVYVEAMQRWHRCTYDSYRSEPEAK